MREVIRKCACKLNANSPRLVEEPLGWMVCHEQCGRKAVGKTRIQAIISWNRKIAGLENKEYQEDPFTKEKEQRAWNLVEKVFAVCYARDGECNQEKILQDCSKFIDKYYGE